MQQLFFLNFLYFNFFFFFCFLAPQPQHVEVPRLVVELELQLPAYTITTATQDPSHIYDLHHSSRQCQILNPLSEARDRTCNHGSWSDLFPLCHDRNSPSCFFKVCSCSLVLGNSWSSFYPLRFARISCKCHNTAYTFSCLAKHNVSGTHH